MLLLLGFAFLAGVVTILSPCILPVLPVVLASSASGGRTRPWGVVTGFILSFTVFTLTLSALVRFFHISPDVLRWTAAGLIVVFGVVLVVPFLKEVFLRWATGLTSRLAPKNSGVPGKTRGGFWSGLVLGASLGLVWTPCVGPIMASVVSLALSQTVDAGSVFITLAYSAGTAVPLFVILQGGRTLLNKFPSFSRHSAGIQRFFGALMILTGVALFTGFDRTVQTWILQAFPQYGSGLTALENQKIVRQELLKRQDQLEAARSEPRVQPNLAVDPLTLGSGDWFNSPPLTLASLKGKVVLVDFWTYSCINCLRTLPYLKAWYAHYHEKGLVIVGVHSPEFAFEHESSNVQRAVHDLGIPWPVVQDNNFGIWKAFNNQYWPAEYLFDSTGKLVESHFGEGGYAQTEKKIQTLLKDQGSLVAMSLASTLPTDAQRSPETYLGWERAQGYTGTGPLVKDQFATYGFAKGMLESTWGLEGHWKVGPQSITNDGKASLVYKFVGEKVYLVINPVPGPLQKIHVSLDGKPLNGGDVQNGWLTPDSDRLYELYDGTTPTEGTIRLDFSGPVRLFSFTFG
jgi:cytochrome c biogenesis protein CcdA/thiol-disulfide isomerase/thioredoxin